ncbi:MAG: thiamine phosphate synthase [Hyphomicrobium sp.]
MASEPHTQLYLVVTVPVDPARMPAFGDMLAHVLVAPRAQDLVSAVLFAPASGTSLDARIGPLVEMVQKRAIAALVADDAQLARTLRADGVHIGPCDDPLAAYEEARDILGTRFIVGVDSTASRHDAMSLGEAGADYIAFGLDRDDGDPAIRHDLVAWWSEIFEVPCVALAGGADPAIAANLADAGADFVAVWLPPDLAPADAVRWLDSQAVAVTAPAFVA